MYRSSLLNSIKGSIKVRNSLNTLRDKIKNTVKKMEENVQVTRGVTAELEGKV